MKIYKSYRIIDGKKWIIINEEGNIENKFIWKELSRGKGK